MRKYSYEEFQDLRKGKRKYNGREVGKGQITEGVICHTKEVRFYYTGEREPPKNVKYDSNLVLLAF